MNQPLVSCMCASRPERFGLLQRAILDFTRQTYEARELVIVVPQHTDYASLVQGFVGGLESNQPPAIKVFARPAHSAGDCLLYAMAMSQGQHLCLWDDDNVNHPDRLSRQVLAASRFPNALTALSKSMYFFHETRELFMVDYVDPNAPAEDRLAATTLLGPRDLWPPFPLHQRTDTSRTLVRAALEEKTRLVPVAGLAPFHVVGVAADTVRGYEDHRRVAQNRGIFSQFLINMKDQLTEFLNEYYWDAGDITVTGRDASAFAYQPKNVYDDLYPVKVQDDTPEADEEEAPVDIVGGQD